MPLPLILAGLAAAAAGAGVVKGVEAYQKNKEAQKVNAEAVAIHEKAKNTANAARQNANDSLEILGQKKLDILSNNIARFIETFSHIHDIELEDSEGLKELESFKLDTQSLGELKEQSKLAIDMASGLANGTIVGGLTALGAYGATMSFGAASTGTAIASLSGVAATNATLAFLGGGSLAAGGFGMAGGTVVLGGLVAGPALAVLGFMLNAKAEKNVDTAYSNLSQAHQIKEELLLVTDLCNKISERANMYKKLLYKLEILFGPLLEQMEAIVSIYGTDFREYNPSHKRMIALAMSVAKAIKAVLDTPILKEDGSIDESSKTLVQDTEAFIAQIAPK